MRINDFYDYRKPGTKISMVTAYDYTLASIAADSAADCVLVGDSAAMVMHGFPSTIHATTEMMALHTAAVSRAVKNKLVIADMPFMSVRKGLAPAMDAVESLARAGAQAVKIEGLDGHGEIISHIVGSDMPVMGHLGLTPQSINGLGGYRTQARDHASAEKLAEDARELERLGCFALVLECVPAALAGRVANLLEIPVIGIGAGPHTDGQVLVMQDLLGLYPEAPSFAKRYLDGRGLLASALDDFDREVKSGDFPAAKRKNDADNKRDKALAGSPYGPGIRR